MITIAFEIDGFKDALHLEDDNTFTETEIEAMKQIRYDNWYKLINRVVEHVDSNDNIEG